MNDRLIGLQQAKDAEKEQYESEIQKIRNEFQETKDQLTSENMILSRFIHLTLGLQIRCVYVYIWKSKILISSLNSNFDDSNKWSNLEFEVEIQYINNLHFLSGALDRPVLGLYFSKKIELFCLMLFFAFANSVDPDKMQHYVAFHLGLYTVCKSTHLGFCYIQRVNN